MKRFLVAFIFLFTVFIILPNQCWASLDKLNVTLVSSTPLNVTANEQFAVQFEIKNNDLENDIDNIVLTSSSSSIGSLSLSSNSIDKVVKGTQRNIFLYGTLPKGLHEFASITISKDGGDDVTIYLAEVLLINAVSITDPNPPTPPTEIKPSPIFAVRGVTFTPTVPNLSQTFTINIQFQNISTTYANHVDIILDGGENFEVMDLTNKVTYADVWSGNSRTATFNIRAKDTRTSNHVTVKFAYNNLDQGGSSTEILNLPLGEVNPKPVIKAPYLKIGTFNVEPQGDGDFILKFNVKNIGDEDAKNITFRLEGTDVHPRGISNVLFLSSLAKGTEKEMSVKMGVTSVEGVNIYLIPISYMYGSDTGWEGNEKETLTVTARQLGLSEKTSVAGTPRVFLSKYALSHSQILAGNTVRLTLNIENSSTRQVGNIKISLGVIPMEGGASGTVFSPVNSSNSFFIEKIGSKGTVIKNIDLYVDPNAAAKTYIVPVDIEYEDSTGKGYSVSEMVNLPVTQESRLQVLSVEVPPMGGVGQPVPISAEFVNVGKVALKNFMVSIEGDFPKENASYFLASMEIGMSDYFQGMIIPQAEGLLTGIVVFTYTDNTNQEVRVEKPFEVNVQQMDFGKPPEEPFPPDRPGEGPPRSNWKQRLLWVIPTLMIAAGGLWLAMKKLRARRGEMFDEEL
ncbi:MAG: hypothetical protein KGZ63_15245 [Clostridiales bacterium]|jgi:hypothetical protein|nr:hypothetical protein [Clostridiales bacterium]